MNIILFGPAGSGKGTQAEILSKQLGFYHFSMGDAFRAEVARKTPLGEQIGNLINKGMLVSDELAEKVMMEIVTRDAKDSSGIVFDGFPRTEAQLVMISKNFDIDIAIEIHVSEEEVMKRMTSRRVCPKCGKGYNVIWIKPKIDGKCDECGTDIVMRDDDKPEQIARRLDIYKKSTVPMRNTLEKKGILRSIDGSKSIQEVSLAIAKILKENER